MEIIVAHSLKSCSIELDDLPDELRGIADHIGLAAFLRLIELYGGDSIYIPKKETLSRLARNREIKTKYKRHNAKQLAQEYNLSTNRIHQIASN